MDKDISLAIKNLRIPLAILIVMGHSDILHFPLMSGSEVVGFDNTLVSFPIAYLCRVLFASANALFFSISGYLFFVLTDQFTKEVYFNKINKRAKTLLVPYMIWQIFFLMPTVTNTILGKYDYGITWFVQSLWSVPGQPIPADPPLWFLRDLMVCMIMSPLYFYILRNKRIGLFMIVALLLCWLFECWPLPQPNGFSSLSISFFALGAFVGIHKVKVSEWTKRYGGGYFCIVRTCKYCGLYDDSLSAFGGWECTGNMHFMDKQYCNNSRMYSIPLLSHSICKNIYAF